ACAAVCQSCDHGIGRFAAGVGRCWASMPMVIGRAGGVVMSLSGTNGSGAGWTARERRTLEDRWEAIAGNAAGGWSFAAAEGGLIAGTASNAVRPAASTIKVPLLLAVLADVDGGRRRLDEAVAVPGERTGGSGVLRMLGSVTTLRLGELLELMV